MDQGRFLKLKFGEIVFFGLLFFSGLSIFISLEIEPKEECDVIERGDKLTKCKNNINVVRSFCKIKYLKEVETCKAISVLGVQDFRICYKQIRGAFKQFKKLIIYFIYITTNIFWLKNRLRNLIKFF